MNKMLSITLLVAVFAAASAVPLDIRRHHGLQLVPYRLLPEWEPEGRVWDRIELPREEDEMFLEWITKGMNRMPDYLREPIRGWPTRLVDTRFEGPGTKVTTIIEEVIRKEPIDTPILVPVVENEKEVHTEVKVPVEHKEEVVKPTTIENLPQHH